jgi:hypothetical protein
MRDFIAAFVVVDYACQVDELRAEWLVALTVECPASLHNRDGRYRTACSCLIGLPKTLRSYPFG